MSNPQITGRTRPGPTEALRAVFSGIGRIFMAGEKRRGEAASQAAQEPRWRSLDETGNVRLLTAEDLDEGRGDRQPDAAADLAGRAPAPPTAPAAPPPPAPAAPPPPAALQPPAAAEPPAALPLPNYDTLSLASIRARLRSLDVAQLRILIDYEVTHAERPEVLGMFERRVEKLQAAG